MKSENWNSVQYMYVWLCFSSRSTIIM